MGDGQTPPRTVRFRIGNTALQGRWCVVGDDDDARGDWILDRLGLSEEEGDDGEGEQTLCVGLQWLV